jgi:hypothetical protein
MKKCDRFQLPITFFMKFYMIFMKFYIDFHQNSSNHRNMFEIVPGIPIIILKQPPPPIVPLPHFLKVVKLGSDPKNAKFRLKGPDFLSSRPPPQSKNLG